MAVAVVLALITATLGVVVGHAVWTGVSNPSPSAGSPSTGSQNGRNSSAPGAPPNGAALAATTAPTLVDINVTLSYQAAKGAGTGMVLSSNGEVLTNNHVIEGATTISVRSVGNGKTYDARVVGYDRSEDVAVIQLTHASGLQTARLGNSDTVAKGDGVVAVGNAQGAGGTPKYAGGAVTALDQSITAQDSLTNTSEQLSGLIETNANIVPGDSGGALVDTAGKVIGMVTAGSEGYQLQPSARQGYAVPINTARTVAAQITSGHSSDTVHIGPTAFLGVEVSSAGSGTSGAQIAQVVPSGPADAAGLTTGDTITAVDGQPVDSPEALTRVLLQKAPGASVSVEYVDTSGQPNTTTVQLAKGPAQ